MASIYKRRRRKPIPDGAEIVQRNKRRFATWTNRKTGRHQRAPLSDDGGAVIIQAETYTIEWFDHEGKRRRKGTKIADKDEAQRLANHLEELEQRRRDGRLDPAEERFTEQGRRPIQEHAEEFRAFLVDKQDDPKYVRMVYRYILQIVESCGAKRITDLTSDGVLRAIGNFRETENLSLRTCNSYRAAIKSFSR